MDTGIGPVFAFADFRVKWTFIGFDWIGDSELSDDEKPEGQKAKAKED